FLTCDPTLSSFVIVLTPSSQISTHFPYTTLFRSENQEGRAVDDQRRAVLAGGEMRGLRASRRGDQREQRSPKRGDAAPQPHGLLDRKSTRLNSSHVKISYAVFCLKKKNMAYIHRL